MSTTTSQEGQATGRDVPATTSQPPKAKRLGGDRWVQVPATWGAYLRLDKARGEKANPKLIFCHERLTIVTVGLPHELFKLRISWLVHAILLELSIPFLPSGSVTLKQGEPKKKGVEGDASYYLTNLDHLRGKRDLVMGVDPAPDLQIEVVISHPVRDALLVHASFGVREVWVCKESGLTFLALGEDGRYRPTPTSVVLPFLTSEDLTPWVFADLMTDEITIRRAFRDWVINTLAPRLRPAEPGEQP